ncbi:MAG: class I SAM-dependent methyltransferase [Hyphomicrobium sp.]
MGIYAKHIGPRLVTCLCSGEHIAKERAKVVPNASGVALEIGIGPGFNLDYYDPARVTRVIGVDPIASFVQLGSKRHRNSRVPVEIVNGPAEALPIDDATIDTAVITFTLCSVDDPVQALHEVRRTLKPDGRVLFLEHGLSAETQVAAWQNRVNPLWRRLAVGCNLTRPVRQLIEGAGFRLREVEDYYLEAVPKIVGCMCRGEAQAA